MKIDVELQRAFKAQQQHDLAQYATAGHGHVERIRLQTLTRLRWLAVAGQSATVLGVYYGLGWPLPIGFCMAAIALSVWLNLFLSLRNLPVQRLTYDQASWLLAYDILQLAVLFYLTGGLQNPFAFLFLVPVVVSAAALPLERTILLGLFALLAATILAFEHMPLPWDPASPLELPPLYVAGMWVAVFCGTVFTAIFSWRVSEENRQMSAALAATEMALAREQQLSALDGLAAAAAHELGTPLATIALVAKELRREMPDDGHHTDDLDLLVSQAARCREILSRLSKRDEQGDNMFALVPITEMLEELVEPLKGSGVEIMVSGAMDENEETPSDEPIVARNAGILFALNNLVENAVDFASNTVHIDAIWSPQQLIVEMRDDGPGFSQEIIDRLGEPFVTTRRGYVDLKAPQEASHEGMGLGIFIAKTLLERSGARVAMTNHQIDDGGAFVQVAWPRSEIDVNQQVE
ncbi:MAG: ActS/PrrB/RegB family redox-sensitive histidine kinase [Hyphomicrobiales bacterium]